jgi:hypothetical protein
MWTRADAAERSLLAFHRLSPFSESIIKPQDEVSSLETIPVEIFQCIAADLSAIDRASLAIVSRSLLAKLGKATLQLQRQSRLELLVRLERDGVCISYILCPECKVFHRPHQALWHVALRTYRKKPRGMRPCAIAGFAEDEARCRTRSVFLPPEIHFNMVAAVMRSHRHKSGRYNTQSLSSTRHYSKVGYPKINCDTKCAIVDGRLIVKTETRFLPCKGMDGVLDAAANVWEYLDMWGLQNCCPHWNWDRWLGKETYIAGRIWTCGIWCLKNGSCVVDRIFGVGGCRCCYTDFSFGVADLPDNQGRVLVLTSWKDVGKGEDIEDRKWKSHSFESSFQGAILRRQTGDIFFAFEQPPGLSGDCKVYTPTSDMGI